MSFRATKLWRLHLVVFLMGLASVPVMAQAVDSPVVFANQGAITTSFVQATSLNGTDRSTAGPWFKVELHYAVTPAVGDYQDSVTFKFWIEGRDMTATDTTAPGKGVSVAFTGSVTYVNILKGKDNYAVVYVHPSTIGRYNSGGGSSDFDRKFNIHVEADVDGKAVDTYDKNKETDANWYQPLKPLTGLIFKQNQCPFIVTDPDRYPALKLTDTDK